MKHFIYPLDFSMYLSGSIYPGCRTLQAGMAELNVKKYDIPNCDDIVPSTLSDVLHMHWNDTSVMAF